MHRTSGPSSSSLTRPSPRSLDFDTPVKARGVRLLFPKSTDFYGRITLYSVHLLGEVPE